MSGIRRHGGEEAADGLPDRGPARALQVHLGNGWVFGNQGGGCAYPAFLAVASLVQGLLGDGAYALPDAPAIA